MQGEVVLDAYWQALREDRRLAMHAAVYAWAGELFEPGWALDAGCEYGFGSVLLTQANPRLRVISCDIRYETLAFARRLLAGRGIRLCEAAVNALPFLAESLSGVCLINLLHLVPDPLTCLQEMKRVLKKGGRLVVSLPLDDHLPSSWHPNAADKLSALVKRSLFRIELPETVSSRLPVLPAARWQVGPGTSLLVGVCTKQEAHP